MLNPILTPLSTLILLVHFVVIPTQSRRVHHSRHLLLVALFLEIGVVVHGAFRVVLEGFLVEEVAEFVDAGAGEDAEDFALVVVKFFYGRGALVKDQKIEAGRRETYQEVLPGRRLLGLRGGRLVHPSS